MHKYDTVLRYRFNVYCVNNFSWTRVYLVTNALRGNTLAREGERNPLTFTMVKSRSTGRCQGAAVTLSLRITPRLGTTCSCVRPQSRELFLLCACIQSSFPHLTEKLYYLKGAFQITAAFLEIILFLKRYNNFSGRKHSFSKSDT